VRRRGLLLLFGDGRADVVLHAGTLLLGGGHVAEALLGQLEGTLFLANAEHFDEALLHGGQADDVSDDGLHGAETLVGNTVAGVALHLSGTLGGLETAVETGNDAVRGALRLGLLSGQRGHHDCRYRKKHERDFLQGLKYFNDNHC
jgi:hypothetical protein